MKEYRKYITSMVGFTFLVVGGTGLFFKFFFKNKPTEEVHTWVGILMIVFALLHTYLNWKPLTNHFKEKKVFLLLVPILFIALFFGLFQKAEEKGVNPREVMRVVLQSNINSVAIIYKKTPEEVVSKMQAAGMNVDTQLNLEEIAKRNQKAPPELLMFFK